MYGPYKKIIVQLGEHVSPESRGLNQFENAMYQYHQEYLIIEFSPVDYAVIKHVIFLINDLKEVQLIK